MTFSLYSKIPTTIKVIALKNPSRTNISPIIFPNSDSPGNQNFPKFKEPPSLAATTHAESKIKFPELSYKELI